MSDSLNNQERIDAAFKSLNADQSNSRSTWVEELFSKRQEHTITGAAFGTVRDIFGAAGTPAVEAQRAKFNDQCAELAADVIASVARVKPMAAGLIRGGMLLDPHGSVADNSVGFTKNFGEGVLLNTVVRGTSSESAFGKWTSAALGGGLKGEIGNHFVAGMGFSAVRTGFDQRTWLDEKGDVSVSSGVTNFAIGTATGALINIPAGMAGLKIAKVATMGLADGLVSRIAVGTGSGAISGGVYGFTDSYVQSRSLVEGGRGFVQGFAVGAFAGGATSGVLRAPRELPTQLVAKESVVRPAAGVDTGETESDLSGKFLPLVKRGEFLGPVLGDGKVDVGLLLKENAQFIDELRFQEHKFDLGELTKALGAAQTVTYMHPIVKPGTPERLAFEYFPLTNTASDRETLENRLFSDYFGEKENKAAAYDFQGIKIMVPLEDLALMEQARTLRAQGKSSPDDVALPEDVLAQLQLIPDRSKVKTVIMTQDRHVRDQLADRLDDRLKTVLKGDYSDSHASMLPDGELFLFMGKTSELGLIFQHEQVHRNHDELYSSARLLDETVEASRYGYSNNRESEAELESRAFLDSSVPRFLEATVRAPHGMAVIANKQIRTLEAAQPEHRSLDQLEILARARYVQRRVIPGLIDSLSERVIQNRGGNEAFLLLSAFATEPHAKAQAAMLDAIEHGSSWRKLSAGLILETVGDQSAVSALQSIALRNPSAAYAALEAATSLHSPDESARQEFLVALTRRPELAGAAREVFERRGYMNTPSSLMLLAKAPEGVGADPISQIRFNLANGERDVAAQLLRTYGDASDVERLRPFAAVSHDKNLSGRALDSMILLHSRNPREQFDFLLDQIAPGSPTRETALRRLAQSRAKESPEYSWIGDDRWSAYQTLSEHLLNPGKGNQAGAAKAIENLPDVAAKKFWFDQSLAAIKRMGGFKERIAHAQGVLALNVFRQVPELRSDALTHLQRLRVKPTRLDILEADMKQLEVQEALLAARSIN